MRSTTLMLTCFSLIILSSACHGKDSTHILIRQIIRELAERKRDSIIFRDLSTKIEELQSSNDSALRVLDQVSDSFSLMHKNSLDAKQINTVDIMSVIAALLQAFGFIVILGAWYFQNKIKAGWEKERDTQRWFWSQTMHFETQLDFIEFAYVNLGMQSKSEIAKMPAYKHHYIKNLEDLMVQLINYLSNLRRLYIQSPNGLKTETREKVTALISYGQKTLDDYWVLGGRKNPRILEEFYPGYRHLQREVSNEMAKEIYSYRDLIFDKIDGASKRFKNSYLIGSGILLVASIFNAKKFLPETGLYPFTLMAIVYCGVAFLVYARIIKER